MRHLAMNEKNFFIFFDPLQSSKRLIQSGFNQAESEAIAEEIKRSADSQFDQFVTKSDLKLAMIEMGAKIDQVESRLESKIDKLELKLLVKMGFMMSAAVMALAAMKFF